MEGPWMGMLPTEGHFPFLSRQKICHTYYAHPWTIDGWSPCPTPLSEYPHDAIVTVLTCGLPTDGRLAYLLCHNICGCHSYYPHPRTIHGPSTDGCLNCLLPPSEYHSYYWPLTYLSTPQTLTVWVVFDCDVTWHALIRANLTSSHRMKLV